MFFNHFNTAAADNSAGKREQMQVHKEASKESSLEGGSQSSKKGNKQIEGKLISEEPEIMTQTEDDINPNSMVNEDEENQSPVHSQFIEDLLGDGDGDQTDIDLSSHQSNS